MMKNRFSRGVCSTDPVADADARDCITVPKRTLSGNRKDAAGKTETAEWNLPKGSARQSAEEPAAYTLPKGSKWQRQQRIKSVFVVSPSTAADARSTRPSIFRGRYSLMAHPESVVSSFGRNTLIARDMIIGHLARASFLRPSRSLADVAGKLVHEINHMVATYKSLVQLVGTHLDTVHLREDLLHLKDQCLKTCDSAKNCILPQLKSETREPCHSSEFTKHANQFIGSVNLFIIEMRRYQSLRDEFVNSFDSRAPPSVEGCSAATHTSRQFSSSDSSQNCNDSEREKFARDLAEAEAILETLENAIAIHFSTSKTDPEKCPVVTRSKRRNWRLGKLFANFKTSYA
ncbi:hypothetical protein M514_04018 [Trichuris suis]|uniref:Uncharacterized protein n=1 Tax=Trichuris suis TaxID=68888 RepID=A0A085NSU5_9BILA|nr:hypothetical protein M514_04018 [Trichuris suis]